MRAQKSTFKRLFATCFMFIVLLFNMNVKAQDGCMLVSLPLNQRVQQSMIIVEGKVISQESYWGKGRRIIFTKSVIEVYKVFKGNVKTNTIEIVTRGGTVGEVTLALSASLELHRGDMGVLTCIPNPYPESGGQGFTTYGGMQGFIIYDTDNGSAHDPFNTYNSIEGELHGLIKRFTKRTVIIISPNPYLETLKRRSGENNVNREILATPAISGFSPTSIASGTAATLTINGTNFGTVQGTGFVEFKNANDGGSTWIKPLTTDYVSWTATQIVVKVPSTGITGPGAGTGQIRVTNADPVTVTSAASLTITYAYSNFANTNYARMPTHITDNSFGGYTFLLNQTTLATNTAAVNKLRAVLNLWTCTSGMNWLLGGSTAAVAGSDGINVATFSSSLSAGTLASCASWYYYCGSGATSTYYVGEIDVEINSTFTWYYGTGTPPASQYDFESVMLHEMGHGHQLNHVIDPTAVMHYSIGATQVKRTLNAGEIAGATFIKDRDVTIGTVCSTPPMIVLSCNAATSAPVTTFTANRTSITSGCSVTFTSESVPETTSWSWNFGGGALASTLQNPTVTFNTAGTYSVTLTATNAYGSTPFTRTSYIVVTAPSCTSTDTNFTGTATDYSSGTGRLVGHNSSGDLAFADKFSYCGIARNLTQLKYYFNIRTGTGNVIAKVWSADGTGGAPGTVLYSQTIAITSLQPYPSATVVTLPSALSITGDYYIGYQIVYSGSDAVSLISNLQGQSTVSSGWRMSSSSVWASYLTLYGSTLSLKVEAVFNNTPTATITPASATTFCTGSSVILNAPNRANYTYQWYKNAVSLGVTTSSYTASTNGSYTVQVSYGTCAVTSSGTTVMVNACNNSDLTNLAISSGALAPVFASATISYAVSVANATTTMSVTPTVSDVMATIKVNTVAVASGSTSSAIALNVGNNTITTVVTAQDGVTIKTYTLTVTRAAANVPTVINLKLFIEGYTFGTMMNSVKVNQGVAGASSVDVEDIIIELRNPVTLGITATTVGTLHTNGTVTATFSSSVSGSYYIVVKGLNCIQTWSAAAQMVGSNPANYDFTTSSSKAYGNNMIQVNPGLWAFFTGDLNNDSNIDNADYGVWESDANNFASGVFGTDLNGDGNVDNADYGIWESNANNFISAVMPN